VQSRAAGGALAGKAVKWTAGRGVGSWNSVPVAVVSSLPDIVKTVER
jgi:hypothetical protein